MNILFLDGTKGFSPNRLKEKACGGILGSVTLLPKYLATKGHNVYVMTLYEKEVTIDGVHYIPTKKKDTAKWDVVVLNRNLINHGLVQGAKKLGAKVVWWLHDIVDFRYLEDGGYKGVDKIIALSEYCKNSFSDFYSIPKEKFEVIPNGVDKTVFYPGKYEDRVKHRFIMASALIKGFEPIEVTWQNLKRQCVKPELRIYSSQKLHELENTEAQTQFLRRMEEMKAKVWQPVAQHVLADIMRKSWALLMPNTYPEICSNLILQARACGLPVITSNIGSASEFIKHNETGILTPNIPSDLHWWIYGYAKETVRLAKDDERHKNISANAPNGLLDWNQIGEKWNDTLVKLCNKES